MKLPWWKKIVERMICRWRGHEWTVTIENGHGYRRYCPKCQKEEKCDAPGPDWQTGTSFWKTF
jgi:hypothetical protein